MRPRWAAGAALALAAWCAAPGAARAQPRYDVCRDLGGTLGFGISSFSAGGDWPTVARSTYGVEWRFLYVYVLATRDPPENLRAFIRSRAAAARALGAIPVFTFYQALHIGQQGGLGGTEPAVVQRMLQTPALMRRFFDNFVFLLESVADQPAPVFVHVEPDTWGFMMWAFGIEGNADATSVRVMVAGSGHPELAGLPDHAGGLGHALLRLRDRHAPAARMGWHASNFRVGTRPEVVTRFYASVGAWDFTAGEHFHNEARDDQWWQPWDPTRLDTNLRWLAAVTAATRVPHLHWQMPIGTTDWHLLGDGTDRAMLTRYVDAGLGGVMFELLGSGDPNTFRAAPRALGTAPPAGHPAGGTAADMRRRLAAYSRAPLAWTPGSRCDRGAPRDAGAPDAGVVDAGPRDTGARDTGARDTGGRDVAAMDRPPPEDAPTTDAAGLDAGVDVAAPADTGAAVTDTGEAPANGARSNCGCRAGGATGGRWALAALAALAAARRRRRGA